MYKSIKSAGFDILEILEPVPNPKIKAPAWFKKIHSAIPAVIMFKVRKS